MKIKADYANAPQWKELTVKSSLPQELKCLDEIATTCGGYGIMKPETSFATSTLRCITM